MSKPNTVGEAGEMASLLASKLIPALAGYPSRHGRWPRCRLVGEGLQVGEGAVPLIHAQYHTSHPQPQLQLHPQPCHEAEAEAEASQQYHSRISSHTEEDILESSISPSSTRYHRTAARALRKFASTRTAPLVDKRSRLPIMGRRAGKGLRKLLLHKGLCHLSPSTSPAPRF
jgi:hypothetical protein